MARIDTLANFLTDVATAIKAKTGKTEAITPANFDTEIASIETGGTPNLQSKSVTITENGTQTISPDTDFDGLSSVEVTTNVSGGGDTSKEDGLVARTLKEYSNNRVTSTGSYAFSNCTSLTTIDLPAATSIGAYSFNNCKSLTGVNIPAATSIGSNAFSNCKSLTTIDLPLVTIIDIYAFYYCDSLTTINLPLVTSIGTYAFYQCEKLTSIDLPLVTKIEGSVFQNCVSLASINIPAVTSISSSGFRHCDSLTTINLPLVTSIGSNAFSNCISLNSLSLLNESVCTLGDKNAFNNTPIASGTGYIYVPDELVDSYKTATNWSTYANQIKPISELVV